MVSLPIRGQSGCQVISLEIRKIIDNLLLERVSRRGISRVTGVSLKGLQSEVKNQSESVKLEIWLVPKPRKILID